MENGGETPVQHARHKLAERRASEPGPTPSPARTEVRAALALPTPGEVGRHFPGPLRGSSRQHNLLRSGEGRRRGRRPSRAAGAEDGHPEAAPSDERAVLPEKGQKGQDIRVVARHRARAARPRRLAGPGGNDGSAENDSVDSPRQAGFNGQLAAQLRSRGFKRNRHVEPAVAGGRLEEVRQLPRVLYVPGLIDGLQTHRREGRVMHRRRQAPRDGVSHDGETGRRAHRLSASR